MFKLQNFRERNKWNKIEDKLPLDVMSCDDAEVSYWSQISWWMKLLKEACYQMNDKDTLKEYMPTILEVFLFVRYKLLMMVI